MHLRKMPVGGTDILVVSDPSGEKASCDRFLSLIDEVRPALTLLLTRTHVCQLPKDRAAVRVLPHPVLRQHLLEALEDIEAVRPADGQVDEPPPEVPAAPRRLRLLAAEDNKTNQLVFAKMLAGLDIDLVFADDGQDAVEKFRDLRPDIVFTDISMPRMDGKQAAAEMRRIEAELGLPGVPIVAMTAHALDGDADAILAGGIDHYLTKPIRKTDLVSRLMSVVGDGILPPTALPSEPVAAAAAG
jgi:hypothetical protein